MDIQEKQERLRKIQSRMAELREESIELLNESNAIVHSATIEIYHEIETKWQQLEKDELGL